MMHKDIEYRLDTVVRFGKHEGLTIKQIIQEDPTYIYWMFDKQFKLTLEVRRASNERTKERRKQAGLSPVPDRQVVGFREKVMLNHLVNHLNNKHFDHAFDEEEIY